MQRRTRLALILVGLGALAATGCARPLLSPTDERSPFDRYDATRNQFAQQYVQDRYGAKEMNLRARLSPKR